MRMITTTHTCIDCTRVALHVVRKSQSKYNRKTNYEQVSGGIHVRILQIRDSDRSNHSEHDHEDPTHDWIGNADE